MKARERRRERVLDGLRARRQGRCVGNSAGLARDQPPVVELLALGVSSVLLEQGGSANAARKNSASGVRRVAGAGGSAAGRGRGDASRTPGP